MKPDSPVTITSITPNGTAYDRYAQLKSVIYVVVMVLLSVINGVTFIASFLMRLAASGFSGTVDASDHAHLIALSNVNVIISAIAGLGALILSALFVVRHRSRWRTILGLVIFVVTGLLLYNETAFLYNALISHP